MQLSFSLYSNLAECILALDFSICISRNLWLFSKQYRMLIPLKFFVSLWTFHYVLLMHIYLINQHFRKELHHEQRNRYCFILEIKLCLSRGMGRWLSQPICSGLQLVIFSSNWGLFFPMVIIKYIIGWVKLLFFG